MSYKFRDTTLEKLHEEITKMEQDRLIAIATQNELGNKFYELRGFRFACLDILSVIQQLDKDKYANDL